MRTTSVMCDWCGEHLGRLDHTSGMFYGPRHAAILKFIGSQTAPPPEYDICKGCFDKIDQLRVKGLPRA